MQQGLRILEDGIVAKNRLGGSLEEAIAYWEEREVKNTRKEGVGKWSLKLVCCKEGRMFYCVP